ncbi:ATP-binding protein [Alkaliphilus hydrothermalis]|uniref:Uncharacterized protein YhaN n=1 Tax=Alkaliphilus hydrothermalis TaxID=1482730 RepID=A0ABS2NSL1_9FIRM|nr:AAA family ATPase [Alkaliphilus hydrothermalis]MBM7615945.1 uncharacterized protein YhaN [Alkaliphilus hydrothermalis]
MKIKKLEIIDFGKFSDTTLNSLDQGMVVIYGKNEAGKTTLFNLINSLIFGFSPAKSENHPYSSWKNERIEFKSVITTDEGEEVHLYRRLLSSPKGQMTMDDNLIELKNAPLPFANHISWEIYNKIYSLRVEDLVEIQGKAWDEVQDKLLANFGNINIRNTKDVIKEINEEANTIHRHSGRGKTLVKEIETEIQGLKKEKQEALATQSRLKNYDQRLAVTKSKIEEKTEEKIILKVQLKRAKQLTPIKAMISEVEELRRQQIKNPLLESLSHNVGEKLQELEEQQQNLQKAIERKKDAISEKQEKIHDFTTEENLILSKKDQVEEEYKRHLKLENLRAENQQLQQETLRIEDRLKQESRDLFTKDITEDIEGETPQRIKGLNIPELGLMITAQQKAKEGLREVEGLLHYQHQQKKEVKTSNAYIVAGIVGFLLMVLGLVLNLTPLQVLGGIAIIYGVTDWMNGHRIKKQLMEEVRGSNKEKDLLQRKQQLTVELEEKQKEIFKKFEAIPIPKLVLENLQELFLTNLIKVKDLIYQLEDKKRSLKDKQQQEDVVSKEITQFLEQFNNKDMEAGQQFLYLKRMIPLFENKKVINQTLKEDLAELERGLKELQDTLQDSVSTSEVLMEKLKALGGGSKEVGLRTLKENQHLQGKIYLMEEQLNKIPDLDSLTKEINSYPQEEAWIFSDLEIERAEEKVEEIEGNLQNLKDEKKELEIIIQQLLKSVTLDEIESRILLLQTELVKAFEKRDALMLLAEVMGRAEELFREENQPDVLKNASRYLDLITGGKYTTIYLEESQEGTTILLKEKYNPIPRRVTETFSKGTLHQLYLSLRLSLIDHLDGKGENLPISFDELLINWDEERLDYNLQLLKEISKKRQIFMFTCHDWMARKIEDAFGVQRIQLD